MTTAGIIENELNNAKKTLGALEEEKINSLRMVEINKYYGKRYGAQADLMKTTTLFCNFAKICINDARNCCRFFVMSARGALKFAFSSAKIPM